MHYAHAVDLWAFHATNGLAGGWTLDRIANYADGNHLMKGGLFLLLYWFFWFRPGPHQPERRKQIVVAIAGTLVALLANRTIAALVPFRLRPLLTPDIGYHAPSLPIPYSYEEWSAFPSDTATYFIALAFGLFRLSPRLSLVMIAYALVAACLPRVYLGIHWPSDIAVGAVLGVVVVWAMDNRLSRRWLAAPMVGLERRYRDWFYPLLFLLSFEMAMAFGNTRDALRGVARALKHSGLGGMGENTFLFGVLAAGTISLAAAIAALRVVRRRNGVRVVREEDGSRE
jgi:undecaprenyl-diphosphatase